MKCLAAIGLALILLPPPRSQPAGNHRGTLAGPNGASIDQAQITLLDQLGNTVTTVAAANGEFRISNVAPGSYSLRADAPPFQAFVQTVTVVDALPVKIELRLAAVLVEQIVVSEEASQPVSTAARVTLGGESVRRAPIRISSRGLQDAVATTPGWASEDNGLLHARGVDDGFRMS
jgi:hypothetical protein